MKERCGQSLSALSASNDQLGLLSKMLSDSRAWPWSRYSMVSKPWATQHSRFAFRLAPRVLRNSASECLSLRFPMWPTATARDGKGATTTGGRIRNGKVSWDTLDVALQALRPGGLLDPERQHFSGKKFDSLGPNPEWVEQLMGFPTGWTDLSELEGSQD